MNKNLSNLKFSLPAQIILSFIFVAVVLSGCSKFKEEFNKGIEQGKRQAEQEKNVNSGGVKPEPSPEPSPVVVSTDNLKNDQTISLSEREWKYQPGDDMRWAEKTAEDSGWEDVVPESLVGMVPPKSGWTGIGWFRLPVVVDESLVGQPLGLTVSHPGASEIYVDGKLMQSFGRVAGNQNEEATYNPNLTPVGITFAEAGRHSIAIRYSNTQAGKYILEPSGFKLKLAPLNSTIVNTLEETGLIKIVKGGTFGVCLAMGLLHLLLFMLYPKQSGNLYYSLFLLSAAVSSVIAEAFLSHIGAGAVYVTSMVGTFTGGIYFVSFTAYLYRVLEDRFPRYLRLLMVLWLIAVVLMLVAYLGLNSILSIATFIIGFLVFIAVMITHFIVISIVIVRAVVRRVDNSWVLGVVGVSFIISGFSSTILAIIFGENSSYLFISQFVCLTALVIGNAVFLARQFARTSTDLERQLLKEVQDEKLKARLALVEVENERRAKELEEARQLQLSMLPKKLPQIAGLEIAAYMKPATEVGGDYYDFHVSKDGTLTVAVGDATGHGLKAGTLVSVTKGLFNNLADAPDISATLIQMSRSLKMMNLRGLFMAITLLKIKDNNLQISAAGMPSALIYRAANGAVEEISQRALPLGSVSKFRYSQQHVSLRPGDVVLLMSDGFPEMFNAENEMLGFEKAIEVLPEIAPGAPEQIIERLVRIGHEWAGSRPQDDDVTFVVLKTA